MLDAGYWILGIEASLRNVLKLLGSVDVTSNPP